MSFNLGSAEGHISMDYDGSGVTQAQRDLDGLSSKTSRGEAALQSAAGTMGKAGLVIAGGIALAVKSAADFEQRLSAIEAVSGATESQMDAVSAKALQLGKDTAFSATESASAMEELIKAGLTVDEVLNGAADATVNLAAAGEIDLPQAATIAANAMNQFNLGAKDMVGVADSIAGAANASAIDVSEFGQSLQQVGAVANLAGVSFQDTATAIALLGNAGIKGSDAGTALKTMFSRLQPTTEAQAETMRELGLITEDGTNKFYDQTGNLKDLSDVSGILKNSLKGMTAQQKQATLQTLFGSDAIRAAAILANEGSKGFDKMADSMGKVSAADVAKTRMDNLSGSIEQLKGSLETAGIMLGQVFLPGVRAAVDQLNSLLGQMLELSPETQKIIGIVAAATAGFLLFGAGLIKTVFFIKNFVIALQAIGALLLANPIVLIIAALVALGVAFFIAYKKSAAFRDFVNNELLPIFEPIKQAVMDLVNAVVTNWPKILATMQAIWTKIAPVVMQAFQTIKAIVIANLTILVAQIKIWIAVLTAIWNKWGNEIVQVITTVFSVILPLIQAALQIIQGVFQLVTALIRGDWQGAWNAIKTITSGVVNAIKAIIVGWLKLIKLQFQLTWSAIKNIVQIAINAIKAVISAVVRAIVAVVKGYLNAIKAYWTTVFNLMRTIASTAFNAIRSVISAALGVIKSVIVTGINVAKAAWTTGLNAIKAVVGPIFNGIQSTISGALNAIGGAINAFIGGPVGAIKSAFNGIKSVIDAVKSAIDGLIDAINSIPTPDIPDLPDVPGVDIPGIASGGIVTRPTLAIVGEGGEPEWIVPESKMMEWFGMALPSKQKDPDKLRGPRGGRGNTVININNPEPERGSDSLVLTMSQLTATGVL